MSKAAKALQRAEALRLRARYQEALTVLKTLRTRDRALRLRRYLLLGHVQRMTGAFEASARAYQKALALADEPAQRADMLVSLALSRRAQGLWRQALGLLKEAEHIYRKLRDQEALAFLQWARGGTWRVRGDISEAIRCFRDALRRFAALADEHAVGYCLNGLGGAWRIKGSYRRSHHYYQRANELFRALREPFGLAYSHCGLGNALRMMGQHREALEHFRKALRIYRRIGDITSSSYTLWSMSKTWQLLGRHRLAERYLQQAEAHFRQTKDPRGWLYCLLQRAEAAALSKDMGKARRLAQEALRRARSLGFSVEACHGRALLKALQGQQEAGCYKALGLRPLPCTLPLNVP
jgi:tetratricopeptide (TPR) repeat protein